MGCKRPFTCSVYLPDVGAYHAVYILTVCSRLPCRINDIWSGMRLKWSRRAWADGVQADPHLLSDLADTK